MGSDICGSNNALNIIRSCSKWAIYDGRPFLSGSYYSPGAIFFATRDKTGLINPHYFGENDFFVTSGGGEVLAMLSCQDALAVFEVDKAGSVSVSYHTPHETGIDMVPVIYPISYTHRGLGNVFGAISFFDDAVFLSKMGLMGLDSQKVNLTRNLTVRSSNVNQMLIREDMSSALMTIWAGYLVIATENRIYLADSRGTFTNDRGGMEYEWFILNGIGGITADSPVYRYSSYGRGQNTPYLGHEDEAVPPSKMIYSGFDDDGMYLFTEVDGQTHPIYQTKERQGGELRPITALLSADNALYFGSDEGSVYVFNSDMRGIPNDAYYLSDDYDEDDYKRRFGSSIDSSHYSFAGHPIRYTVKSANDNGGFPHLLKSDVKNSLTIKCRSGTRGTVVCEVTTDSSTHMKLCEFPSTAFTFDDLDFSSISLCSEEFYTRMIPGREKKWVEKQITLYTEGYCMPFAINNISHRFCLVGNIKKK